MALFYLICQLRLNVIHATSLSRLWLSVKKQPFIRVSLGIFGRSYQISRNTNIVGPGYNFLAQIRAVQWDLYVVQYKPTENVTDIYIWSFTKPSKVMWWNFKLLAKYWLSYDQLEIFTSMAEIRVQLFMILCINKSKSCSILRLRSLMKKSDMRKETIPPS